jgi:Helix-turn-helix domain
MDEVERAWQLRRELGRELKTLRKAAGLSQPQLAARTGYSRSTIATLESTNGGAVARAFWEQSDAVFRTGDTLARRWDDIQQHVQAARALTATARHRPGPRRRAIAGTTHLQALRTLRSAGAAGADPDGLPQARMACAQLGWPVVADGARSGLVTGTVIDALQIPRAVGQLAISWWLDTGGAADPVRRLPAMPRPDQALAVISAGGSFYFLARAGACPWPAAGPPSAATHGPPPDGTRATGPVIFWHSHGSRVPLPPGRADGGDLAEWAQLPSRGVTLASPVALLELLAKALSVIRDDGQALALPGGVLAVPAPYPVLPPAQR